MASLQELVRQLSSLSVFRGLRELPLLRSYETLLRAAAEFDPDDPSPLFDAWGAFFKTACDCKAEENLAGAVTEQILCDDNAFSRAAANGEEISSQLAYAAQRDLKILLEVCQMQPEAILKESGAGKTLSVDGLPRWKPGRPVRQLAGTVPECMEQLKLFYLIHGCGMFVKYRAFIWREGEIRPVRHPDPISIEDLKGYEYPRSLVIENTEAFLQGLPANNCLLYGDRGTGKSSTVKAIMNRYFDEGLRVIEIPKESVAEFPCLLEQIAEIPLQFVIFIDDLSFSHQDETYTSLKAVLEGGVASRPRNTLIYATSNRRHLVRETFSDREGDEIHRGDTIEESLSLADRFGLTVNFSHPGKQEYLAIVRALAEQRGIADRIPNLEQEAEQWALLRGGRSPRCAVQFIDRAEAQAGSGNTIL